MDKSTKRALSFSALIGAAVIFGMVVAGSVDLTPRSEAQKEAPARTRSSSVILPSFADIADEAMPAVVSLTSTNIVKGSANRRNLMPFGGEDGEIGTKYHGSETADKVEVRLAKERDTARVVGKDPATDLALLKIDAKR